MKLSFILEAILLASGVSLLPLYVLASGNPQPAHVLLAIFSLSLIARNGIPLTSWSALFGILCLYILAIESIYVIHGKDPKSLINALFFLYNLIISIAIYSFCRPVNRRAITIGVIGAATLALVSILLSGVELEATQKGINRAVGTFNNPNQLGYFSVCLLSITYLLYCEKAVSYYSTLLLVSAALLLSLVSLSKAAMLSIFLVICIVLKPRSSRFGILAWVFGAIISIIALLKLFSQGFFDQFLFLQRIEGMSSEQDSSLAARGYYAIFYANALQTLFGLGSANADKIVGHETHSTIANVLNKYGLVGVTLFLSVLLIWAKKIWSAYGIVAFFCIAGPPMLYGLTHNGSRFTFFWILYAVSLANAYRRTRSPRLPE